MRFGALIPVPLREVPRNIRVRLGHIESGND